MQDNVTLARGPARASFISVPPLQADHARLLALASEEELALMKKTQQLAEEVRVSHHYAHAGA